MSFQVFKPYEVFNDLDGTPLENGNLYIGTLNLNPETNPVAVYWDDARTLAATQPIRTLGGYPSNAGTPSNLYMESLDYSITVRDKNNKFVYSDLDAAAAQRLVLIDASTLASIAAMTLLAKANLTDGMLVNVSGYYVQGDGGGGQFYWDSASVVSENGGTVIEADEGGTGRWIRIFDRDITVKWFGAKGDGIQDDTAFIQAALDYAKIVVQAIGVGVDQVTQGVFVPAGTYLGTGVVVGEGITFYGEGQNISFLKTVGAVTAVTLGESGTLFSGTWMRDIGVQGDDTTSGSIGIQTYGQVRNCGIERVFVLECDTLVKWNEAFATHMYDCHLRGAGSFCLDIDNGSHSVIKGCRFDVAGEHCVQVDGQTNETLNLSFEDCSFQSAQKSGFIGVDIGSVSFINCDFESNNKVDSLTHAYLRLIQGTAAYTNTIYNVSGGFWSTGSSAGSNHVGIEVEVADTVNLNGVHVRGNTFAKGVTVGAGVDRLNLQGCFWQSVADPVESTATTIVVDSDIEGSFLRNNVAFDTASAYAKQDVIVLRNDAASAGLNTYGGSIVGVASGGGTNRRVAMVPKQTGSDSDQMGWAFFTHPSASDAVIAETLVLNHLGELEIGGTGGSKLMTGAGSPEGADTAPVGSIFMRTDGGASTSMYIKETGTGDTGWVAK